MEFGRSPCSPALYTARPIGQMAESLRKTRVCHILRPKNLNILVQEVSLLSLLGLKPEEMLGTDRLWADESATLN